jgi:hypothetical protein
MMVEKGVGLDIESRPSVDATRLFGVERSSQQIQLEFIRRYLDVTYCQCNSTNYVRKNSFIQFYIPYY